MSLTLWLRQVKGPLHLNIEMYTETTSPGEAKGLMVVFTIWIISLEMEV